MKWSAAVLLLLALVIVSHTSAQEVVTITTQTLTPLSFSSLDTNGATLTETGTLLDLNGTCIPVVSLLDGNGNLVATGNTNSHTGSLVQSTFTSSGGSFAPAGTYAAQTSCHDARRVSLGAVTVTNSKTIQSCYTTNDLADASNIATAARCGGGGPGSCTDGATISGLADTVSGSGVTWSCTGGCVYHSSSVHICRMPGIPTMTSDGTCECTATGVSTGAATAVAIVGSFYMSTFSNGVYFAQYGTAGNGFGAQTSSGFFASSYNNATVVTANTMALGSGSGWIGMAAGSVSGGTVTLSASTNNETFQTGTTSGSLTSGQNFVIGCQTNGSNCATFETEGIALVGVVPVNATTGLCTAQSFNQACGVTGLPSLTYATPGKSGGTYTGRLQITNGESGATLSIDGTAATGVTVGTNGKFVDYTGPSLGNGSHTPTISQPDGNVVSFPNALTVTAADNEETCLGASLAWSFHGPSSSWVCPSGSGPGGACAAGDKVSTSFDWGALQNFFSNGSSSTQPLVESLANGSANNEPTIKGAGGQLFANTSLIFDNSITASSREFFAVFRSDGGSGGQRIANDNNGVLIGLSMPGQSTAPNDVYNATSINWTSTPGTTFHYLRGTATGTGTVTICITMDGDNSTQQCTTLSASPSYTSSIASGLFANPNGGGGPATATTPWAVMAYGAVSSAQDQCICNVAKTYAGGGWTCP